MEIKTDRALTERPERWEPDRTQPVKWTTEGTGKGNIWVFCDVRHTLVVWDMSVSWKCTHIVVKQGGTAESLFALDRSRFCQGLFCSENCRIFAKQMYGAITCKAGYRSFLPNVFCHAAQMRDAASAHHRRWLSMGWGSRKRKSESAKLVIRRDPRSGRMPYH